MSYSLWCAADGLRNAFFTFSDLNATRQFASASNNVVVHGAAVEAAGEHAQDAGDDAATTSACDAG